MPDRNQKNLFVSTWEEKVSKLESKVDFYFSLDPS